MLILVLRTSLTTISPSQPGACEGKGPLVITDEQEGYIMSPGHPRDYFNNLFCEWLIKANKDEVVKLMFLAFDLEDR